VALFPVPAGRDSEPVPPVGDLLERQGDAVAGRIAFHSTGTCAKCHVVNGIGLNIGPELSEIGKKLSRQALFESILFPSAAISHNYETWVVLDANGNITTGLLVSETDSEIQLKDEKGLVRTIKKSEIDERRKQEISDLHKILSVQELVDIVEFMSTLQQAQATAAAK
jgi:putative heme-binding domain-containing protein